MSCDYSDCVVNICCMEACGTLHWIHTVSSYSQQYSYFISTCNYTWLATGSRSMNKSLCLSKPLRHVAGIVGGHVYGAVAAWGACIPCSRAWFKSCWLSLGIRLPANAVLGGTRWWRKSLGRSSGFCFSISESSLSLSEFSLSKGVRSTL